MTKEEMKKYLPYAGVGLVAGMVGLLMKSRSSTSDTSSTDSSKVDQQVEQNETAMINQLATNTNNQLESMASQYNNQIAGLSQKLNADDETITGLTNQLQQAQTTLASQDGKIKEYQNTINSQGASITGLTSQVESLNSANTQLQNQDTQLKQTQEQQLDYIKQQSHALTEQYMWEHYFTQPELQKQSNQITDLTNAVQSNASQTNDLSNQMRNQIINNVINNAPTPSVKVRDDNSYTSYTPTPNSTVTTTPKSGNNIPVTGTVINTGHDEQGDYVVTTTGTYRR